MVFKNVDMFVWISGLNNPLAHTRLWTSGRVLMKLRTELTGQCKCDPSGDPVAAPVDNAGQPHVTGWTNRRRYYHRLKTERNKKAFK